MGKVQGNYASIVRGVSQQHPSDRLEGQHGEQVNLISDPVRGLVRRNGFILRDAEYSPALPSIADAQADSYSFRCHPHTALGTSYDILYRTRARVGNDQNNLTGLHCFDKSPSGGFVPVVSGVGDTKFNALLAGGFSAITSLGRYVLLGGNTEKPTYTSSNVWDSDVNRETSVFWVRGGGYSRTYTLKARRASDQVEFNVSYTTLSPSYDGTLNISNVPTSQPNVSFVEGAVWINSAHTFTAPATGITVTLNGTDSVTDSLISAAASGGGNFQVFLNGNVGSDTPNFSKYVRLSIQSYNFPTMVVDVLSVVGGPITVNGTTSSLVIFPTEDNPNYATEVNEQTAAYNEAVNTWAADAAASIIPSRIAQELIDALTTAGFTGWVRNASHGFSADCDLVEVSDSGGSDFIVGVSNQTRSSDEVTPIHTPGKVLKVAPKGNEDGAYYLIAAPKNEDNLATYQDVIWREAAGTVQTPTFMFALATVVNGTMYAASTPALLTALIFAEEAETLAVPALEVSAAGDVESNLPPPFFANGITGLFVFQDRLGILAGGELAMSQTGKYFNFYRTSVLTVPDDDPISGGALGSEGDIMRKAALYDRNLIIFGDRAVYNISGRTVQTPQTFSISVQLNVDNTSFAQPVGAGQNVSFLKEDSQMAASRMMQVRAGLFQDSPVVDDASKQLRDYINGTPAELVSLVSPDVIFVRTEHFFKTQGGYPRARPWGLYVYHYLDQANGERVMDSWSSWEWSTALGTPVGIGAANGGDALQLYTLRFGINEAGAQTRGLLALSCSARPDPTGLPYLDGLTRGNAAEVGGLWTPAATAAVTDSVFTSYGPGYSYDPLPNSSDAERFTDLSHPHYTLGDAPAELTDPLRWEGLAGWYSDAVTEFGPEQEDNLWTGLAFPAYVDVTNPYMRDRDSKSITLGRLTLTKLRVTTVRSAGFTASFRDYQNLSTSVDYGGNFYRYKYDTNVWVGRNVQDVQIRLAAKAWYPLTISAIEWQGQFFLNGRRV